MSRGHSKDWSRITINKYSRSAEEYYAYCDSLEKKFESLDRPDLIKSKIKHEEKLRDLDSLEVDTEEYFELQANIDFLNEKLKKLKEHGTDKETRSKGFIPVEDLRKWHKREIEVSFQQVLRMARFTYSLLAKTIHIVNTAAGAIAFPVRCALSGVKGLWDFYIAYRDKAMGQRKTRMAYGLANIAAVSLTAAFMATPIGFAILSTITMATGVWKESYITHQARKAVTKERSALEKDKEELNRLKKTDPSPQNEIKIEGLIKQIEYREEHLKKLREKRLESQAKVAYYATGVLGASLIISGLLFPPILAAVGVVLAISGAALLVANALVYTIDKNTNPPNGIARWVEGKWDGLKNFFSKPKEESPVAEKNPKPQPRRMIKQDISKSLGKAKQVKRPAQRSPIVVVNKQEQNAIPVLRAQSVFAKSANKSEPTSTPSSGYKNRLN